MVKKGQAKPDPTAEELEFIFQCFADNKNVLEAIQETDFPLRNKRFISSKSKEFDAAKKVLKIQLEREIDPIIIKSRMEHRDKLVAIVNSLMMNNLDKVLPTEKGCTHESEYLIKDGGIDSLVYPITKEQLSSSLTRNMDMICDMEGDWLFHKCFLSHLGAELPDVKIKGMWQVVEEQPYELIEKLRILAESKNFKGKCPVCKDWQ